jgi:putative hydrolase of the HAD superfamily
MLNQVRAVAFDLDNTLWDVAPVIERAEALLYEWLREHCPRIPASVSLDDMRAARELLARQEPHNAHDFTYLRITALARHAREAGYGEEVAQRAFEVFFTARHELDVFADVRPAFERLRTRYQLASFSNGNAEVARIGGLGEFFSLSLNARMVGVAKPHPRCFERLAADLHLEPSQIIYVGDDPKLDVEASRSAGMHSAWINRFDQRWPEDLAPADLELINCTQLADALGV